MGTPGGTDARSSLAWREVTPSELGLLSAVVSGDWEGAGELRSQLPGILARQGCGCGCGTIDLLVTHGTPAREVSSPVPKEGSVLNAAGEDVGGLLLFLRDGLLHSLEVYSIGYEPLPLPALERVRWEFQER